MASIRTEAEVLARALEIGALSVADAVAWADTVIEREEHPDASICEVALSGGKYEPDVVAVLREVPGTFDEPEVRSNLLRVLSVGLQRDRARADRVAQSLYQLAIADQIAGEPLRKLAWWAWDGLDLADAGIIQQTRDQVIDEMIAALQSAAMAGGDSRALDVIELLSPPSLKLEGAAWELLLWYCEPFDRARSFRTLLTGICAVLGVERQVKLSLPPEQNGEDFVEGTLSWGDALYDIYFEYSLGYLQLSNPSEQAMRSAANTLQSHFTWRNDSHTMREPA